MGKTPDSGDQSSSRRARANARWVWVLFSCGMLSVAAARHAYTEAISNDQRFPGWSANVALPLQLALILFLGGAGIAFGTLRRRRGEKQDPWLTWGVVMNAMGAVGALVGTASFTRGRQVRRRGRAMLPRLELSDRWARLRFEPLAAEARRTADAWRENGRTEHASVAAFVHLASDLLAVGAPPELIADAQRDALHEIRHAEICFSLARALDGTAASPAPFPEARASRTLPLGRNVAFHDSPSLRSSTELFTKGSPRVCSAS